jgi:hypothetical protein
LTVCVEGFAQDQGRRDRNKGWTFHSFRRVFNIGPNRLQREIRRAALSGVAAKDLQDGRNNEQDQENSK